jgi:hypothetical protein
MWTSLRTDGTFIHNERFSWWNDFLMHKSTPSYYNY